MADDAAYGQFSFEATNNWLGGSRSCSTVESFFAGGEQQQERRESYELYADQPAFLAGENSAPNAVQHYLHALVSCLTTTVIAHASVRGIAFDSLSVVASGEMDARGFFGVNDAVSRGYKNIVVTISAASAADEQTIRELTTYSPVLEMVSNAVPTNVEIHSSQEQRHVD